MLIVTMSKYMFIRLVPTHLPTRARVSPPNKIFDLKSNTIIKPEMIQLLYVLLDRHDFDNLYNHIHTVHTHTHTHIFIVYIQDDKIYTA